MFFLLLRDCCFFPFACIFFNACVGQFALPVSSMGAAETQTTLRISSISKTNPDHQTLQQVFIKKGVTTPPPHQYQPQHRLHPVLLGLTWPTHNSTRIALRSSGRKEKFIPDLCEDIRTRFLDSEPIIKLVVAYERGMEAVTSWCDNLRAALD